MARPPRLKEVPLDPRRRTALFLTMLATVVVRDLASAERADPDCHTLRPLRHRHQRAEEFPLSLEDKLALSPIVVQARLISRSHSILSISAMPEIVFLQLVDAKLLVSGIAVSNLPISGPPRTTGCTFPPCESSR